MRRPIFQFRQFNINQAGAAMKVGADGMLLGAWVKPGIPARILDIGTGNGLLALMLAQKSTALIDAIEIDERAFLQAKENFENSPWKNRITAIHASLQGFTETCEEKYGLIISNPPYFEKPNDNKGNNPIKMVKPRSVARSTDTLPLEELAKCSAQLLAPDGKLFVILPYQNVEGFIFSASVYSLHLQEILTIKSYPHTKIIRAILCFGFDKPNTVVENEFITYYALNQYSNQYIELTKDYHNKEFTTRDRGSNSSF